MLSGALFSAGNPHCLARPSKLPPRARVAEVSTTVASANRLARSSPPTLSGATRTIRPRRSSSASQTTSRRLAGSGSSKAVRTRTAVSWTSSTRASAAVRAAAPSGSAAFCPGFAGPMAVLSDHAASRTVVSGPAMPAGSASHRPGSTSVSARVSRSPASLRWSTSRSSASFALRRAAAATAPPNSSAVATPVTRSTSSCASSMTTTSCSGSTGTPVMASMASSAWLVTTTSTLAAEARAFSAKQSEPTGQRDTPRHSRADTLTWRQACSVTPGTSSSRSPSVVFSDHSCSRCTSRPSLETAKGSNRAASSGSSGAPEASRCRHR